MTGPPGKSVVKSPFRPPPDRDALSDLPVHVAVRDYPEVLAILEEAGIDAAAQGARPLGALSGPADLVDRVAEGIEWRRCVRSPPSTGASGGASG